MIAPPGAAARALHVEDLETPCVLVDRGRLDANLARVRGIAERAGVRLRPHVKTHKSLALARMQRESGGADGLTASKVDEALVFIEGGARSVTVAYPVLDARKLDRLIAACAVRDVDLRMIADSLALVDAIGAAAGRAQRRVGVFLKVDVGLHRVGVAPESPEALTVAQGVASHPWLDFVGLLAHAGHAYAAPGVSQIAAIAEAERLILLDLADRLGASGVAVREISVGSTPSVLAAADFAGVTEIRPGNYVYLDGTAVRLGLCRREDVALTIMATVVSRNADYLIVDAGSKVLSSDGGPHGVASAGFGDAYGAGLPADGLPVERLSEEHGWLGRRGADVPVGARVAIIPNHACVVTNLVGAVWLVDGGTVLERWPMQAQARVL